ncbi:hypothetical protein BC834DRAFT_399604 [Gloeopeniophorella convolvens]|nr:hypothetical protein BC834DRAFT_399604 [Gloeopeniophorella convolvens]
MPRPTVSWSTSTAMPPRAPSPAPSLVPSVISIDTIVLLKEYTGPPESPIEISELRSLPGSAPVEPLGAKAASTTTSLASPSEEPAFTHHKTYFFEDGNVTFLVDNMLYCVHRYFFARDSTYFSTRLARLGTPCRFRGVLVDLISC